MALLNIRYDFRCPDICPVPVDELYHAAIEQVEWAERLGFVSVTLSEHHGSDDGYLPSLVALASAIAARTENIHIMLAALIAPMHDPLRVAEDLAVLDRISKGRISVVVAAGYVPSEFDMFGRRMRDRVALTEEMVETLKAAWTGEAFEFRGRRVRVTPTPYQKPRPMIWLGGSGEKAARRAARIADGFLPTMPEFWDHYRDEVIKQGRPDPGPATSGGVGYLHITHDPNTTWAKVAPHALHEMNAYGRWAAESGAATGYEPVSDADALRAMGMHQLLTPAEAIEMIRGMGEMEAVMFHPLMGGLDPALAWENLRLFESEVLPHL
ncbi:LLM class flavin-dependent oxidoreductase [Candidatus Poriferisocius sp.]|uniref:LLM class flavin-dependent oxidoreductase n=1 Tax=Candidatus Poriferisocius sp. TaxID=3101276 RepID=UPI003B018AD6